MPVPRGASGALPAPSLPGAAVRGDLHQALAQLADAPVSARSAWARGWVLLALGRSRAALAALDDAELEALGDDPATVAAARATRGALLRQVGLHDRADDEDAAGVAVLPAGRCPPVQASLRIGLVADAVGQHASPSRLHERLADAGAAVARARDVRQTIRFGWVRGEVALLGGDADAARVAFAEAAGLARRAGARRHEGKSLVFLAAAHAADIDRAGARRLARQGRDLAAACGAAPIVWPAELILAEVADDPGAAGRSLHRARTTLAPIIADLPSPLREEAARRPPAAWLLA